MEYDGVELDEIYEDSFECEDDLEDSEHEDDNWEDDSHFEYEVATVNTSNNPVEEKVNDYRFLNAKILLDF